MGVGKTTVKKETSTGITDWLIKPINYLAIAWATATATVAPIIELLPLLDNDIIN